MKLAKLITFAITTVLAFACMAFNVNAADEEYVAIDKANFPDDILRDYLSKKVDLDGDGAISPEEMPRAWVISIGPWETPEYYAGEDTPDIDLEGINLLTKVHELCITGRTIKNADLRGCETLEGVSLQAQSIEGLDLTGLEDLRNLQLFADGFSDFKVDDLPSLETFVFSGSADLSSLELSNLPKLRTLICTDNSLETIDIKDCPLLNMVDCSGNKLTELDLAQIPNLMTLVCNDNMISELDITGSKYLIRDLNAFDPDKGSEQGMYPLQPDSFTKIKGSELIKTQYNGAENEGKQEDSSITEETEENDSGKSNTPFIIFGVTVAVIICGALAADIILKNRKNKDK